MGLLSFFQRKAQAPAGEAAASPDAVAQARTRARQRLIGATVLLGIGVIGFPLVFETQPRPIPVDIPIEIPRKESLPPLQRPQAVARATPVPAMPPAVVEAPAPTPAAARAASATAAEITERAAEQGRDVTARAASSPVAVAASKPASAAVARAASAPPARPAASAPKPNDDGQRAQALLEGKPNAAKASDAGAGRLVVQVGAYTDADKLREARQKVEKLGMKTYTQVVDGEGGKRTRVRVGPFATREEADKAAARIKAAGLPVAVLTL
ncbi:SPOR domain-containing protein [Aquincola sp. S2]|uniref:SPOR domain-containing protein n=1 Tax=Pseudaquabacterium terrae TaxID=2732868 RepID=A0ABX2EQI9_9BURK|nr:SPOR domain-containing protein [Aquabacterium terrae]NRF70807.1 SPOR domain-containing protein [Aquabacterium terrae]